MFRDHSARSTILDDKASGEYFTLENSLLAIMIAFMLADYDKVKLNAPCLVLYGKKDPLIFPRFIEEFYEKTEAKGFKRLKGWDNGLHEVQHDFERYEYYDEVIKFCNDVKSQEGGGVKCPKDCSYDYCKDICFGDPRNK